MGGCLRSHGLDTTLPVAVRRAEREPTAGLPSDFGAQQSSDRERGQHTTLRRRQPAQSHHHDADGGLHLRGLPLDFDTRHHCTRQRTRAAPRHATARARQFPDSCDHGLAPTAKPGQGRGVAVLRQVADRIRAERERRAWTQEELALRARMNVRTVQRAESSDRVRLQTLRDLALAFDVDLDALVSGPRGSAVHSGTSVEQMQRNYIMMLREAADLEANGSVAEARVTSFHIPPTCDPAVFAARPGANERSRADLRRKLRSPGTACQRGALLGGGEDRIHREPRLVPVARKTAVERRPSRLGTRARGRLNRSRLRSRPRRGWPHSGSPTGAY